MVCPICNDTRWKSVVGEDGVERVVRCDCWRAAVVDRLMREARVPHRYLRCEMATFEPDTDSQREAYRLARGFVDAFPVVDRGLVLYGRHGVGKTHLAVGILKAAIRDKGARGYFFETRELLRLVRDTYNRSVEETEMDVLAPVLKADLLVLDDLGAERTSDWVQETLGLVVNTRYNERRPTIFTSNLADPPDSTEPNSFIFQLGARTRSRLLEMCDWVEMQGVDIRETGQHPSPDSIHRWQKESPASPENLRRGAGLPPKSKSMARARLREGATADLPWAGGRAGTKR
ncbi:MAG TPA: ATP-binding protein [Vicinamibacterales bacterium]|nr:ATP-binding protein [Vicinamibacterales bacterium]